MSDEEEESEQERNTESDRDSDIEENESDESRAKTVGVVGTTATMMRLKRMTSKVFAALQLVAMRSYSGEDDGNEYGNNEDRSHEAPSNKHCSNDSGGKNPHGAASNPGRNGAANAAVVVRDNSG